MTRLTLRKGFALQPVPGGVGHITDSRTGDSLVVPAVDYVVLAGAGDEGLDSKQPEVAAVLERYRAFYVEKAEPSFYELDLEDAPTMVEIPTIAPVAPPTAEVELKAALAAAAADEPETKELAPFELPVPLPEPEEEFTQPAGEQPDASGKFLSQEENLRQALETQPTEQVSRAEVAKSLFDEAAFMREANSEHTLPPRPAPAPPSRRPLILTLTGITLLALAVVATFALRPGGETLPETFAPTTGVVDASVPTAELIIDAGTVVAVIEPLDAGAPDAGELRGEEDTTAWLTAELQARGRVKMGEVIAAANGAVTWTVEEAQRVKAKQSLGTLAREGGGDAALTAPSVGLAMLKQPSGPAKRGAVLAEIIYFEAWAKGVVRGKAPNTSWRCEISSASARELTECKISVVTPKAGGWLVTVAVEPRWFDQATDAVLRVAPGGG
ncbi:MAG: hypothetical protein Q8N23_05650 [Archangium sp.]|nr:hypothetical protein [Archangium sp.]MDP3574985.1 hypothetical protein [Archangium sp.]